MKILKAILRHFLDMGIFVITLASIITTVSLISCILSDKSQTANSADLSVNTGADVTSETTDSEWVTINMQQ